jgi:hypothetical protein
MFFNGKLRQTDGFKNKSPTNKHTAAFLWLGAKRQNTRHARNGAISVSPSAKVRPMALFEHRPDGIDRPR